VLGGANCNLLTATGQHNEHLVAKDLPGAGDLLLFDDEGGAGFSRQKANRLATPSSMKA
jgi:hypothetical protein